jgi:hypothetical protein
MFSVIKFELRVSCYVALCCIVLYYVVRTLLSSQHFRLTCPRATRLISPLGHVKLLVLVFENEGERKFVARFILIFRILPANRCPWLRTIFLLCTGNALHD